MSNGHGRVPGTQPLRKAFGFTLLELMMALAVVAVLLALAVPAYQRYVQRGERAEAVRLLLAAAACQERIRAQGGYYDTARCLEGVVASAYEFRIEPPGDATSLAFTLIAEPKRARGDDPCGSLSLNQAGTRGISGDTGGLAACWGGR
jgi:type IV pilus assembly protein PilE